MSAQVVINEICTDPVTDWSTTGWDGTDGGGSITATDEYIELYNASDQPVDLAGWMIAYEDSRRDTHMIDTALIRGEGDSGTVVAAGGYCLLGNIRGDMNNSVMVLLYDGSGVAVDRVTLGSFDDGDTGDNGPEGNSPSDTDRVVGRNAWSRDTDTDSADLFLMPPSPGRANSLSVRATLQSSASRCMGYADSFTVTVTDPGYDTTPGIDTVILAVDGTVDGRQTVRLPENGPGSGVFDGMFRFAPPESSADAGICRVSAAETLVCRFFDDLPAGTVAVAVFWKPFTVPPRVILNEVLANPSQSETDAEWVELYNADTVSADIGDWLFISDDDTTAIPSGTVLPPGGYCVAARELLDGTDTDTDAFETIWGDGSGIWGDAPEEQYPAFNVSLGLTNTLDSVSISDGEGYTSAYRWTTDAGNGVSWARSVDSTWLADDSPSPGAKNKVTPALHDFGLVPGSVRIENGVNTTLEVQVVNTGLTAGTVAVTGTVDDSLSAGTAVSGIMAYGDTVTVSLTLPVMTDGYHDAVLTLPDDENADNNRLAYRFLSGEPPRGLVINEIMFNPDTDRGPEWIEFYNAGDAAVSPDGISVADPAGVMVIDASGMTVPAGGFMIAVADTGLFRTRFPQVSCPVVRPSGWITLNNGGDDLILYDSLGTERERISYDDDWMGPMKGTPGVSLERTDPDGAAGSPDTWWGCLDTAGATPGRANSVLVSSSLSDRVRVWAVTDPFWPEGDGTTDISFTGPARSTVTVKLYDTGGRQRYEFARELPMMGAGSVAWNGKDADGRRLPVGIYILHIKITDGQTGKVRSAKNTVVIARPLH